METVNNQIYKLALHYCDRSRAGMPEAVLLGLVKLSSLSKMALGFLLKEEGVEDSDEIRESIGEIKTVLDEKKLDPELIKNGIGSLLPVIDPDDPQRSNYQKSVSAYDENTTVETIVGDVISSIPPEELNMLYRGKDIDALIKYSKSLHDGLPENPAPTTDGKKSGVSGKTPERQEKESSGPEAQEKTELFNERLRDYIEDMERFVPVFVKAGKEELLWRQSVIVAIDDGFGFSTFVNRIEGIYVENKLIDNQSGKSIVKEAKIVFDDPSHVNETYYREFEEEVRRKGLYADKKKLSSILAVDLSEICDRHKDPRFRDMLRVIEQNCDSIPVFFRLPFLDRDAVSEIAASITDIMSAESLIVPPLPLQGMLDYMHKRMEKYGYTFEKGCDEFLEKAIINEKNDGRFYGFRTLNKIIDTSLFRMMKDPETGILTGNKIKPGKLKEHIDLAEYTEDGANILENLVGMEKIIEEIDKAINQVKIMKELNENGGEVEKPTIHMMFRGNPGTGKTTVARIVGERMKQAGILEKGNFIEIKGRDLCGRYVGETTPKTTRICRDAYGSVLFIDEAYELYREGYGQSVDYGREAMSALVAEMENHRDDMCVIFAGYTDEMNTMVTGNTGLKDRIPIVIDFPNYTREQLEEIFFRMIGNKFEYEPGLRKCVHEHFGSLSDEVFERKDFSNARYVRNLYESVWGEAALRRDMSDSGKLVIRESDFRTAVEKAEGGSLDEKKRRTIGFVG